MDDEFFFLSRCAYGKISKAKNINAQTCTVKQSEKR